MEVDPVRHRGIAGGLEGAPNKVRGVDLPPGRALDRDQLTAYSGPALGVGSSVDGTPWRV